MWSVYVDTSPIRTISTRGIGIFSRRAYYGPLAPLRSRRIRGEASLPGRRWVRVQNICTGISGTDIALTHLRRSRRTSLAALPRPSRVYLGQEVVGEVADIGPDVEFLRIGDRVAYQFDQCCDTLDMEQLCRHCASGNFALCENRYLRGPSAVGGGWSDQMVVHEQQLFPVPDSLSDEQAAMLEPCAIAVHAALRYQPQPGDNVLVIGAGTLGLLTIQAVQIFSPDASITALARYPVQIEMATQMGATSILYYDAGMAAVARHTGGRHFKRRFGGGMLMGGFDVVFDTIGSAQTMQNAIRWTRGGGVVIEAGSNLAPSSLDLTPVWHQEISVLGATSHGTEQWPVDTAGSSWLGQAGGRVSTFALAATLIRERRLIPERLITHRFPLREVRYALQVARDKATHRSIKVLMDVGNLRNPSFSVHSQTADRLTS